MAIKIPIITEFKGKGVKDAKETLGNLGKSVGVAFAAVGAALGVAGAGIAAFGKDAIGAASTLEESLNAVKVAYGDASGEIVKLGEDAATRLGVTQSAFNAAAVRFSAFAEKVVGTGGDVTGFLDDITTRAADFASVFNIEVADALQIFQSGLSGEAEPLKRFGINLLDSEVKAYAMANGIGKVGKELTETEKVQARYGLLMQSTAKTQGDFANTSGSLANSQRILKASFEDLQAEVGTALLPVMADLSKEFANMLPTLKQALTPAAEQLAASFRSSVLPAIQNFTRWLASPQGVQTVKDLTKAIVDGIVQFFNFTGWVIKNREALGDLAVGLGATIAVFKTLRTTLEVAKAAQILFNSAAWANPYVAAAAVIALGIAAVVISVNRLKEAQEDTQKATNNSAGELNRFNNIKLSGLKNEINGVANAAANANTAITRMYSAPIGPGLDESGRSLLQPPSAKDFPLNPRPGQVFTWYIWEKVNGQQLAVWYEQTWDGKKWSSAKKVTYTGGGGGSGDGGKTPAEKAAEAFKKVSDLIRETRDKVAKEERKYREAVSAANEEYLANEKRIREEFTGKLADIIQQSKDRIRGAFREVAAFGIGSFLSQFKTAEEERKKAFEDAQAAAKEAGKAFTDSFVAGDPVTAYLDGLKNKVAANKRVLETSAKLVEAGFSQTFIEQIITTGDEGGTALAEGLLKANPKIIAEVQSLYAEIEKVSETGADQLANTLYEKQGLATTELKTLFSNTQSELLAALTKNYEDYTDSLDDAAKALRDSIAEIREDFEDEIEKMGGSLGGLGKTVKEFKEFLGKAPEEIIQQPLPQGFTEVANNLYSKGIQTTIDQVQDATGILVDSADDLAAVFAYLNERIKLAQTYLTKDLDKAEQARAQGVLSSLISQRSQLSDAVTRGNAVGTVININVKTSSDQSLAMVGKTLGNTITKYVTTGGQVLVSSGSPVG